MAVASDHPLAARTTVTLPELADEPFMVWGPRPFRLHRPPHRPLPPGRLRTPYRTHRPAGHTPGHRRHRHPPHRLRHHGTEPRRGRQGAHSPSRITGVRPSPRALPAPDHLPPVTPFSPTRRCEHEPAREPRGPPSAAPARRLEGVRRGNGRRHSSAPRVQGPSGRPGSADLRVISSARSFRADSRDPVIQ
ncbi:hypothetical protein [Streptomyces monomycini]|uniref:hypothetical protein n=1 Tax=Streptomyces monomycini TaxID=371720 RepID=UPI001EEC9A05|nr:hypothetical protein [Streptomyces monomycini]